MSSKNPNHIPESKPSEDNEAKSCVVDNSALMTQDLNENFLNLKNQLIFFQDKSKLDEIRANLSEDTNFLKISDEVQPEDVKSNGLDFVIVADVSESMFPFRVFLKKSMYFALKDIENFAYRSLESSDEFPNIRLAFVKYTDRTSVDEPCKCEVLDFVEYNSLEEICKQIDSIDIKNHSVKKRAVFDGLKAVSELSWNDDSIKMIAHYCADPQYGEKYTTNPKGMPDGYDPFPKGCSDVAEEDILEPISNLGSTYNFIKLGERLVKFEATVKNTIDMDTTAPNVIALK